MNGTLSGILALLMWSVMTSIVALTGQTSGVLIVAISSFIGGIVLSVYYFLMDKNTIKKIFLIDISSYIFVTAGIGVYLACILLSFKMIAPFEANSLNYLWPSFLALFSIFLGNIKLTMSLMIGCAVSFIGVLVMFGSVEEAPFFENIETGHFLAIFAAAVYGLYSAYSKNKKYSQTIMVPAFFTCSIFCFIWEFTLGNPIWPEGIEWGYVILLGVFRISYSFWDYGMKEGNIKLLLSLSYFVPPVSMIFVSLITIEPINAKTWLAALLIAIGCIILNLKNLKNFIFRQ